MLWVLAGETKWVMLARDINRPCDMFTSSQSPGERDPASPVKVSHEIIWLTLGWEGSAKRTPMPRTYFHEDLPVIASIAWIG